MVVWLFRLTAMMLIVASTAVAQAEKRIALVIGNSDYKEIAPLANPANDARLIGRTLEGLGFELVDGRPRFDLGRSDLIRAIREFTRKLQASDAIGLFYYAGHAIEHDGRNYLVPVDAALDRQSDIPFELVDLNVVLEQMHYAANPLNMLILDACRNNPFSSRGVGGVGRGLGRVDAPKGTVISYATRPGDVSQDGTGTNSPFTAALAEAIRTPNLDVLPVFNKVGVMVAAATKGAQQPWLTSSPIEGKFVFNPKEIKTVEPSPKATGAFELEFWNSVKDSPDPGAYEAYLAQYPQGTFAPLAKWRISKLSDRQGDAKVSSVKSTTGATDDASELAIWHSIKDSFAEQDFNSYLEKFANGLFADRARDRIAALQSAPESQLQETRSLDNSTKPAVDGFNGIWHGVGKVLQDDLDEEGGGASGELCGPVAFKLDVIDGELRGSATVNSDREGVLEYEARGQVDADGSLSDAKLRGRKGSVKEYFSLSRASLPIDLSGKIGSGNWKMRSVGCSGSFALKRTITE